MLTSIEIERFKGIRRGKIDGLRPLTVLVGPNNSGKSSVLEAVEIACGFTPAESLQRIAVRQLKEARSGRWFLWRGGRDGPAELKVSAQDGDPWTIRVLLGRTRFPKPEDVPPTRSQDVIDGVTLQLIREKVKIAAGGVIFYGRHKPSEVSPPSWQSLHSEPQFIDPACSAAWRPLHELRSGALEHGRMARVVDLVRTVVPTLKWIDLAIEGNNLPVVHMVYESHSVPVSLEGGGVRALVQLCFELAESPDSVVLLEEPEARLHPAAIRQSATAVANAALMDTQVLLATHSMEYLDALLDALGKDRLDTLVVVRLALSDGVLSVSRFDGADVAVARHEIGSDLR